MLLDSKIARLLELILKENLSKIAKGRDLLRLLEMLLDSKIAKLLELI